MNKLIKGIFHSFSLCYSAESLKITVGEVQLKEFSIYYFKV